MALRNDGAEKIDAEHRQAPGQSEQIRGAVGDRMDILTEDHALWRLPAKTTRIWR